MMSFDYKKTLSVLVLLMVYIGGLFMAKFIFNYNTENTVRSIRISEGELPVLSVLTEDGHTYNYLNGYKNSMDIRYIHDSLGIVSSRSSGIRFKIDNYQDSSLRIDYTITDYTGENILARSEISPVLTDEEGLTVEIPTRVLASEDREFILHLMLYQNHDNPVHYYMRINQGYSRLVDNYISFIEEFIEACIQKDKMVAQYIEPDPKEDNSDLANVSIRSSYENITYGYLKPEKEGVIELELCEFDDDVAMFRCSYKVRTPSENKKDTDLYEVHERYRVRRGTDRVVLLNFERRISEVFQPSESSFGKNNLCIGITPKDFDYLTTSSGDRAFFKKNNRIWVYNNASGNLTQISLWEETANLPEDMCDIKLLDIDSQGNLNFMVYGYIPAGEHEGMNGMILFQYNPDINSVVERLVIHSDRGFAYLKKGIDNLAYLGADNKLYVEISDKIYSVNLLKNSENGGSVEVLSFDTTQVSDSRRYLAYVERGSLIRDDMYSYDRIYVKDLMTGTTDIILAERNSSVVPLGFLADDLIYGEYDARDIHKNDFGKLIFPARRIKIVSVTGELKKEYSSKDSYIQGVELNDAAIELKRLVFRDGSYHETVGDRIIYSRTENRKKVEIRFENHEDAKKKKQGLIVFPNRITENANRLLKPVLAVDSEARVISAYKTEDKFHYYVFRYGMISKTFQDFIPAIQHAADEIGVVVDNRSGTVWQRTTYSEANVIDYHSIDERYYSKEKIESVISENKDIEPLNRIALNNILYFVKHDIPVLARTEEKGLLLIVGYDNYNLIMRPYDEKGELSEEFYYGKKDSEELFEANNNRFLFLK